MKPCSLSEVIAIGRLNEMEISGGSYVENANMPLVPVPQPKGTTKPNGYGWKVKWEPSSGRKNFQLSLGSFQ